MDTVYEKQMRAKQLKKELKAKHSYCFVDDNKHKNQHWAKRGKNIKR